MSSWSTFEYLFDIKINTEILNKYSYNPNNFSGWSKSSPMFLISLSTVKSKKMESSISFIINSDSFLHLFYWKEIRYYTLNAR